MRCVLGVSVRVRGYGIGVGVVFCLGSADIERVLGSSGSQVRGDDVGF